MNISLVDIVNGTDNSQPGDTVTVNKQWLDKLIDEKLKLIELVTAYRKFTDSKIKKLNNRI